MALSIPNHLPFAATTGALALLTLVIVPLPMWAQEAENAMVEVSLAPPMAGATWSDTASWIELRPSDAGGFSALLKSAYSGFPQGFPLSVEPGDYDVFVDGYFHHRITLVADAAIDITDWRGPRVVTPHDGNIRLVVGELIALRDAETLAERLKGLNPKNAFQNWEPPMARAGLSPSDRAEAVTRSRETLPVLIAKYLKPLEKGVLPDMTTLRTIQLYLDLLSEFGDSSDAEFIMDLPTDSSLIFSLLAFETINHVVSLERRLGTLDAGISIARLRTEMASNPEGDLAGILAEAVAAAGHNAGFDALVQLHEIKMKKAGPDSFPPSVPPGMAFLRPEKALSLARGYLKAARSAIAKAIETGNSKVFEDMGFANNSISSALEIVLVYGTDADQFFLSVPVLRDSYIVQFREIAEAPGHLYQIWFDPKGSDIKRRFRNFESIFASSLCQSYEMHRAQQVNRTKKLAVDALIGAFLASQNEPKSTAPEEYQKYNASAERIINTHSAGCEADAEVNRTHFTKTALEIEEDLKARGIQFKWWWRPGAAAESVSGRSFSYAPELSQYDHEWLMAQFSDKADPEFLKAFELWHRLLTAAWRPEPEVSVSFGAERRSFRLRFHGPFNAVPLLGHLDTVSYVEGDDLIIAARLNATYNLDGLIFGQAPHAQFVSPYSENNFRKAFDYVTLEQAGTTTEAVYEETTGEGVHYFRVPFNGSYKESYLRFGMVFYDGSNEHRWSLDFALHYGPGDFYDRLSSSTGLLGGMQ